MILFIKTKNRKNTRGHTPESTNKKQEYPLPQHSRKENHPNSVLLYTAQRKSPKPILERQHKKTMPDQTAKA